MTKSLRGRGDAAPFFGSKTLNPCAGKSAEPRPKLARVRQPRKGFLDGVVDGERVFVAVPVESEKAIEIRTRVALATAGALVMKHTVEVCHRCRQRPSQRTGLGLGATDLLCIVPPKGRALFIEMKHPGYSPSDVRPDQHCFMNVVRRFGAISGIATSEEEALALLDLARSVA